MFLGLDLEEVTLRFIHHPFSSVWNQNSCTLALKLPLDWKPAQRGQTLIFTFSLMSNIYFREKVFVYVWSKLLFEHLPGIAVFIVSRLEVLNPLGPRQTLQSFEFADLYLERSSFLLYLERM